jgi:hypothetical protein
VFAQLQLWARFQLNYEGGWILILYPIWPYLVFQHQANIVLNVFGKIWESSKLQRNFPNFPDLVTFPKRYFESKSTNKWLRYHQKKVEKYAKIQKKKSWFSNGFFIRFLEEI